MKYKTYVLNLERMTKIMRKSGKLPKRIKGIKAMEWSLNRMYALDPMMIKSMDFILQAEEYYWLTHGRRMYYIESADLANSMARASSQVATAAACFDGLESFVLNFPRDVLFDGRPAQAVLVSIDVPQDRPENFIYPYLRWLGSDARPNITTFDSDFSISCAYQEERGHAFEYIRCCVGAEMIPAVLKAGSASEWWEIMNDYNQFDYFEGVRLDAANEQYQFDLIRFVLHFLLYKKALPERIREGLPGIRRQEVETAYTTGRTHYTISPPRTTHDSPAAHYRSWHFRQLSAERFYRGEHAHKPPGSRVIFVSDAFVGRDADHRTVEDK